MPRVRFSCPNLCRAGPRMAGWGMSVFPRQKNDPIYALTEHAVTAAIERDVRQRKVSKGAAMFAGIVRRTRGD
jgi:hypothetical protein